MRRNVVRLDRLVPRAVACHQPYHQAALIQQERGAVRPDLVGPRPAFSVHPHDLLHGCRHDRRLILRRDPVRIDKRALKVHFLVASSVILTYAISSTVRRFLKKKSIICCAVFSGIPHFTSLSTQFLTLITSLIKGYKKRGLPASSQTALFRFTFISFSDAGRRSPTLSR